MSPTKYIKKHYMPSLELTSDYTNCRNIAVYELETQRSHRLPQKFISFDVPTISSYLLRDPGSPFIAIPTEVIKEPCWQIVKVEVPIMSFPHLGSHYLKTEKVW